MWACEEVEKEQWSSNEKNAGREGLLDPENPEEGKKREGREQKTHRGEVSREATQRVRMMRCERERFNERGVLVVSDFAIL